MKQIATIAIICLLISSCTSSKKLAYLNAPTQISGSESFTMDIPDYQIQPRDILYITVKAMTSDGRIIDFLSTSGANAGVNIGQGESGGFLYGYNVDSEGYIEIPAIGSLNVDGLTVEQTTKLLQESANKAFKNSTVECKLLSFKFTVIGEVKAPGTYMNYNNYLTVLEAIGRSGGIDDFGDRSKVLVIRPVSKGTRTFAINLQDKKLLSSEAYFLLPNDVVIVQPLKNKIFNLNLPTVSFIITTVTSAITTTLLLINYLK